ncbi:MAG TPA: hypothetical protein VI248_13445 [Kineosporiaceae bacterium]
MVLGTGSPSQPTLVGAYGNGARPVITAPDRGEASVVALMTDYTLLERITVSGARRYGIQIFGKHAALRDLVVDKSGSGVRVMGAGALIDQVQVMDLHMIEDTPGGTDDFGAVDSTSRPLMSNSPRAPARTVGHRVMTTATTAGSWRSHG